MRELAVGAGVDRPYIWKTFGFKEFGFGRHNLNVVRGNLRVESTNVTNEQDQVNVNNFGEAVRVRGYFQQPTTHRAMFSVSF